ncbi:unnamed protein product [Mucor hiemalis]
MLINDKRLGLMHPVTNQFQNFANTSSPSSSSSTSAPTSLDSCSSSSSKQIKLSPLQKGIVVDMFAMLDGTKMWRLSTGTVVEQQMKMFALECNFEQCIIFEIMTNSQDFASDPVHSMVLDVSDKSWLKYFTPEEIQEIKNHQKKVLVDLPSTIEDYIKKLRECQIVTMLKSMLTQELSDPGCEWIRSSLLQYRKQKATYFDEFDFLLILPLTIQRLIAEAPTSLQKFTLIGFLVFETKFTLITCVIPMGYVTRVTPYKSIDLPEEADDLNNQLLSILKAVYRARLTMERTDRKVRKEVVEPEEQFEEDPIIIGPSFNIEPDSNKRRKSSGESSEA